MAFAAAGHAMCIMAEDGVHQPAIRDLWRGDGPRWWFAQIFDCWVCVGFCSECIGGFVTVSAASGFSQPLQGLKVPLRVVCGRGGKLCGFHELFGLGSLPGCGGGDSWIKRGRAGFGIESGNRSTGSWEYGCA